MTKRLVVKYVVLAVWCALWFGLLHRYAAYFGYAASLSDWRFAVLAAAGPCLAGFLGYLETQEKLAWIYGFFEHAIVLAAFVFGALALFDVDEPRSFWWLAGGAAFVILESVSSFAKDLETEERWKIPGLLRSNKWKSRLAAFRLICSATWAAAFLAVLLFGFLVLFRVL